VKFTQQMAMHLNGGSKFSELRYKIFADGKPTTFMRVTRTDGSPKYTKTQDVIFDTTRPDDPAACYDVLNAKPGGLQAWLEANVKPQE
jgi:hypothetical protein